MNLNQLYYFRKLAQLQNYTKASKELYIAQPSLSAAISSLEEELKIALFFKQGRNIKLTKYGEEFYKYVCTALDELEKGIEVTREKSSALGGVIDIGCIPTLIGDFMPKAIKGYLKMVNSKTKFNIFNGMTLDIVEGIKSEKYDVGFCSFVENETELEFLPILAQELILLVNNDHPLAKEKFINLKDLHAYPLITYRENLPIGKTIKKLLNPLGLNPNYAYDDEITIGGIVSTTNVAAITARTPFLLQFTNLKLISIDVPADSRLIYMCYNKNNYISKTVEHFIKYILENERNLPG